MDRTALGDRMKAYEADATLVVDPASWLVVRLDGRAFHTYTRGLTRPFDDALTDAMDEAAAALAAEMDGARFAYLQSDECSLVVPPRSAHAGEHWFGGKVQKIASVSASVFTAVFARARAAQGFGDALALFDARAFSLPDDAETKGYLCWRQADATRNAVSMVASTRFSHRQLHRVGVAQRRTLLADAGVDLDSFDARHLVGRVVSRENYVTDVRYVDRRTEQEHVAHGVVRSRWVATAAPRFAELDDLTTLTADRAVVSAETAEAGSAAR